MEFLKIQNILRSSINLSNISLKYKNFYSLRTISFFKKTVPEKKEEYTNIQDDDYEITLLEKEEELLRKRNKSRLQEQHRNIVHGKVPYKEPMNDVHLTLKYKRRIFGRYGNQSEIDPGTLWPNPDDIKKTIEYERVAFPYSMQEFILREQQKIDEEYRVIEDRQKKISNNLQKLNQWKKEVEDRAAKKLALIEEAKAKKDALIEEVRRHFGYKIDPKDEKFQEMLIAKERAQKKKLKEDKAKAKQAKLLQDMVKKDS